MRIGCLEVEPGTASRFAKQDFDALELPPLAWQERIAGYVQAVDRIRKLTDAGSPLDARPVQSPVPPIEAGHVGRIARDAGL